MSIIGQTVSFGDWDDATGEPITITGIVESEFNDPNDRYPRSSLHVRTASGAVHTPYADECRPVVAV